MADPAADLYRRFEIEVRTPARRLLVDALLPDPASIETSLPAPEPVRVSEEDLGFLARRDEEPEPEAPRPKRKPKSRAPAARKETARSLEEEVAEFMKRDRPSALAPDDDLDAPPPPATPKTKD